jgi:prolyl 4-hydroxylase
MSFLEKKKFNRSGTEEDYGKDSQTSNYRTSWTYFIPERTPISRVIKKRVAKMLKCRIKDIEPIQIVRYKEGQYYKTHHDSQLDEDGLHRDHTFFVYLNTIRNGSGGTTFPYLRTRFLPRKGCAVYWQNLRRGDCDGRMRHRGDIVKDAQKYGMNIWIRTPRQDQNPK